jgi:hypothetical protein
MIRRNSFSTHAPAAADHPDERTMKDDKRIEIVTHLLSSADREAKLYRMARRSLGLRVYSDEALELFGQILGVGGPRQKHEDTLAELMLSRPSRLH